MTAKYPTVDASKTVVRDSKGRRITTADIDLIISEGQALPAKVPGRPSMTGAGQRSPQVTFRLAAGMLAKAEAEAADLGVSLSQLSRLALEDFLQKPKAARRQNAQTVRGVKAVKKAVNAGRTPKKVSPR